MKRRLGIFSLFPQFDDDRCNGDLLAMLDRKGLMTWDLKCPLAQRAKAGNASSNDNHCVVTEEGVVTFVQFGAMTQAVLTINSLSQNITQKALSSAPKHCGV